MKQAKKMQDNFCAFILSHGRPDNVKTYSQLKKAGYTGKIYIIVDNEDQKADQYIEKFGKDNVIIFDKKAISKTFDGGDNFDNRKTIVYARNVCFEIAERLGIDHFIQLDDDYYWFGHRSVTGAKSTKNLDNVFKLLVDFVETTNICSVAFSQGGDHIGGYDPDKKISRKAMNSFVCSTKRKFQFLGRINEDVNTYVYLGGLGKIFLTIMQFQLDQKDSQTNNAGMTDVYKAGGTYLKSFYSVIFNPSCVKIKTMGIHNPRLHHSIKWENAVVNILDEKHKKY